MPVADLRYLPIYLAQVGNKL